MNEQSIRRTVVVGVDGSDSATDAVRWGAAEAARRRVPLRLVIGFPWREDVPGDRLHHGGEYRELLLGRARDHLAAAAAVAGRAATRAPEPRPAIAMLTSAWPVDSCSGIQSA